MSIQFIFSAPFDVHFPKVFDIEGESKSPNARVIFFHYDHSGEHYQRFIVNKEEGTIKSASSNLYVAASDEAEGASIIQLEDPKESIRTWEFVDDMIRLKGTNLVITRDGERSLLLKPMASDLRQQSWGMMENITTIPFVELDEARKSDLFRIVLKANNNLCLGLTRVTTAYTEPLFLVSCATNKNQPQLFYYDELSGIIGFEHSSLMAIDICDGLHPDHQIVQYPAHNGYNQQWKFTDEGAITLRNHDLCFTVKGNIAAGSPIVSGNYCGTSNQLWEIKPVNIKKSARK